MVSVQKLVLIGLFLLGSSADAFHRELFTTNAICKQNYCINPIFPGLKDLGPMESSQWVCSTEHRVAPLADFCKGALDYSPSLPVVEGVTDVKTLVKKQEKLAITAFAYHVSAMGLEAFDHTNPSQDDDPCIQSVWRMACYTYFPKAERGCKEGQESRYLRPCQNACSSYVEACAVECCDESVQCVFEHSRPLTKNSVEKSSGYVPQDGPSPHCTGSDESGAARQPSYLLALLLVMVVLTLQGCELDQGELEVPSHQIGNWRRENDYTVEYEFVPPGSSQTHAKLNSCAEAISPTLQCSGRGVCTVWDPNVPSTLTAATFCECNRDWADPECRTPRKSQTYAYLLSLFLGWLGADQVYLGHSVLGALKACTLGGCGVWWLYDVIRIGSAPVYSARWRVAADLPHWAFVLSIVTFFLTLSFIFAGRAALQHRVKKRQDAMFMKADEEARVFTDDKSHISAPYAAWQAANHGKRYAVPSYL